MSRSPTPTRRIPTRRVMVALVRHGDYHQPKGVPSAHLPHPLTERGREQARALGATLLEQARELGLELHPVLDCSTLLRASQTASLAAAALAQLDRARSYSIAEFDDLSERCVGAAANLHVDAIAAAIRADPRHPDLPEGWKSHPRFRLPLPGAESLMQAGARIAAHIEGRVHALRCANPEGPDLLAVFVSHGGALRHAAVCMGALALAEVQGLSMYHCGHVCLDHVPEAGGGPGHWQKIAGQWKIRPAHKAAD